MGFLCYFKDQQSAVSKRLTKYSFLTDSSRRIQTQKMRLHALKLGDKVTLLEIDKAQHDLFLSPKKVREDALDKLFYWLSETV